MMSYSCQLQPVLQAFTGEGGISAILAAHTITTPSSLFIFISLKLLDVLNIISQQYTSSTMSTEQSLIIVIVTTKYDNHVTAGNG